MKVELYYHRYKHSLGIQQEQVKEMCRRFDFEFHPVPAYLISLDDVMGYCEGKPLPNTGTECKRIVAGRHRQKGLVRAKAEAKFGL